LNQLARLVGKPIFWILFVGTIFAAPLVRGLLAEPAPKPPAVRGIFPSFALKDDRGSLVESSRLRGHAFLAGLLCVHCAEEGPLSAETMRQLQHRSRNLGDSLLLVSFSADGDPDVLSAVRHRLPSSGRWTLLAGAPAEVQALFRGPRSLVLVDRQQRVRGLYPGSDEASIAAALRDAALVLNER
jgi:cytochrome oxidase Cu insertion factor (SCO1/SenC/PrrC family)